MNVNSLEQILGVTSSRPLEVAGHQLTVRMLSAADEAMLEAIAPRPIPPRKKDESAGSLAPPVPDPENPAYRAEYQSWYVRRLTIEAGVALEMIFPPGLTWSASDRAQSEKWAACAPQLARFPIAMLEQIVEFSRSLGSLSRDEAVAKLITPAPPDAKGTERVTPDRYFTHDTYVMLRVCERFGLNPLDDLARLHALPPPALEVLAAYDRVRYEEESPVIVAANSTDTLPRGQSHEPG